MKQVYTGAYRLTRYFFPVLLIILINARIKAQSPTQTGPGICSGVIANFNSGDNGYNSPSVYGNLFDSAFYYHPGRGYWTDYSPPFRTSAPDADRILTIISPPYVNPNAVGTFNVGFHYVITNRNTDLFQVRIISVTQTAMGTITDVVASSGAQHFNDWSDPVAYDDLSAPVPDPTPLMGTWQGDVCIRLIDADITNAANTTYRVEVSYVANQRRFVVFDNVSIGPELIPTPVNFIGLVANRNADMSVSLKWDVSEEINVAEYQVERSSSITSGFTTVGTVFAKGKSIYSYTDNTAPATVLFYRIKSVDIDGKTKYSGILRIKGNSSSSYGEKINVYPNPAKDNITIEHQRLNRDAKILVTSIDGKVLRTLIPAIGASHSMISLNGLTPGIYIVRMDDGKGGIQTMKFVKE
jgi:hypothetical protein